MRDRNYGIDLLRIVSMFMVVVMHILYKGSILSNVTVLSAKYWTVWFLETASLCAVNCFALISGYLMYRSGSSLSRLMLLWLQTAFYSVLLTAVFAVLAPGSAGISAILDAVFPVTRGHYWYITSYFGMCLLAPLLNAAIEHTAKKTMSAVLLACFVFFCVLPRLLFHDPYELKGGYSTLWLCLLYVVGGYIRKYDVIETIKKRHSLLLFLSMILLTYLSKLALEYGTKYILGQVLDGNVLVSYVSPTIVLAALGLFFLFAKHNAFSPAANKLISAFAPASLGVYLIHDSIPFSTYAMPKLFSAFPNFHFLILALLILAAALAVYVLCSFVEMGRIALFRRLKCKELCAKAEDFILKKISVLIK